MRLKTILVCLTTEANTPSLLKAAAMLARRTHAHVICLHTIEAIGIYPGIAVHINAPAYDSFNQSQHQQAEAIKQLVDHFAASEDFVVEWRLLRAQSTTAADRMLESARAADLVVMAQEAPSEDRYDQHGVQAAVIRGAGRPVLVVPHRFEAETLGQNVLIGWSPTREATRAAHDALILTAPDASVRVLVAGKGTGPADSILETAKDFAAALGRHGLKVEVISLAVPTGTVANALQQEAEAHGADMIVTGAFGHSKLYDFVLGAVTNELLHEMRLPVLFSK